jgi:hypothetical protein
MNDEITMPFSEAGERNDYLLLRHAMKQRPGSIPEDTIGPANQKNGNGHMLTVHFAGLPHPIRTDLDPARSFCNRSETRSFYRQAKPRPGDLIVVRKTGDYECSVSVQRARMAVAVDAVED